MYARCTAKIEDNIYNRETKKSKLVLVHIKDSTGITIKRKAIYYYGTGNKMLRYLKTGDFIEFEAKFEEGELEKISDAKIIGDSYNQTFTNIGIHKHPKKRRYFTRLANGDLIEIKCDKYGVSYGYPNSVRRSDNEVMRSKGKLGVFFDINDY